MSIERLKELLNETKRTDKITNKTYWLGFFSDQLENYSHEKKVISADRFHEIIQNHLDANENKSLFINGEINIDRVVSVINEAISDLKASVNSIDEITDIVEVDGEVYTDLE